MDNSDCARTSTNAASFSSNSPLNLPDGSRPVPLGSGEITKRLGTGGMATVYEIWNPRLEMHRAVKIINPGSAETAFARFETEIKISAKLRHPNIVEIHGTGEWNGLPFIEMEKVEGLGLDRIIKDRGAMPESVSTAIGIMICRALDYAHHRECVIFGTKYQGVIHRDLKPSNIMLTTGGTVKLMDFGIARPMDANFQTLEGLVSGTLQYLAPEQIEKKDLDARTDVYTLGICLYEMVTGAIAFPQTSFAELVTFKTRSRFKPIDEFPVSVSAPFKRAIARCMQQDPMKRFQDAAELLALLEKIHRSLTDQSPETVLTRYAAGSGDKTTEAGKRSRIPWKGIVIFLVAGGISAVGYRYGLPMLRHQKNPVTNIVPATVPVPAENPVKTPAVTEIPSPAALPTQTADTATAAAQPATRAINSSRTAVSLLKKPVRANSAQLQAGTDSEAPLAETQPMIAKLRELQGLGNDADLAMFLRNDQVNDGEWYLAKAKLSFNKKKYHECENFLEKSRGMPCALMGKAAFEREAAYYEALCATIRFDANTNNQNYTRATGAWTRVLDLTMKNSGDPYGKKAESELGRIEKQR